MAFIPCTGTAATACTTTRARNTLCGTGRTAWTNGVTPMFTPMRAAARLMQLQQQSTPPHAASSIRMEVSVGSQLPAFSLPINGGGSLASDEIADGPTVLYFYPKDETPGCTTEAKDFRDMTEELDQIGARVVGVSRDSVESHDKFVEKHELPFPLISDDGTLSEGFGVWKKRKLGPVEMMAIQRSTFIIKDGMIVKEWRGIKAGGHAAQVLEAVKEL